MEFVDEVARQEISSLQTDVSTLNTSKVPTIGKGVNLLDNWYFVGGGSQQGGGQLPINRGGKTTYNQQNRYGIDRWYIWSGSHSQSINSNYVNFTVVQQYGGVLQYIDESLLQEGQKYTLSILTTDGCFSWTFSALKSGRQSSIGYYGVEKMYSYVDFRTENNSWRIFVFDSATDNTSKSVNAIAVKLELGDRQTLARNIGTEANPQWVLNDPPPNYKQELAKCSDYQSIVGKGINLLDNWYFIGGGSQQDGGHFPINQRGQTSYTGVGYNIDRWRLSSTNQYATLNSDSITLYDDTIDQNFSQFRQCVEIYLDNQTLCLSWLIETEESGSIITGITKDSYASNYQATTIQVPNSGQHLLKTRLDNVTVNNYLWAYIQPSDFSGNIKIKAVKLELGDEQTLARNIGTDANPNWVLNDPPPNYEQELAKCQRYQQLIRLYNYEEIAWGRMWDTRNGNFRLSLPTTMRTKPTMKCLVDGDLLINMNTITKSFNLTSMLNDNNIRIVNMNDLAVTIQVINIPSAFSSGGGATLGAANNSDVMYILLDANL